MYITESRRYSNTKKLSPHPKIPAKCSRRAEKIFESIKKSERSKRTRKKSLCEAGIHTILSTTA